MYPRFAELFGQPLPAYFTMLVVGFACATWLGARWAKRAGLDHDVIIDLGLASLIAGVLGARLLHVIADGYLMDYVNLCIDPSKVDWRITRAECTADIGLWDAAREVCKPKERDCFAWAAFWRGGLTYYGGLVAATAYGLYFLSRERFPMWRAADMAGMVMPIGLFFGRLGCFFAGCCFGVHTEHGLGMSFPPRSPASESQWRAGLLDSPNLASLPVHPTQLYEAAGCLGIAAITMLVAYPRRRFDGQVFLIFLMLYSVVRFAVEALRADDRGGALGLSTSQLLSVIVVVVCVGAWGPLRRWSERQREPTTSEALGEPPAPTEK